MKRKWTFDNSWTLFLDRDGVINTRFSEAYVLNPSDFEWIEGSLNAIVKLGEIFGRIIVVTNQQGVGKGLMTIAQLESIHQKMMDELKSNGGRIDKVYYCTAKKEDNDFCRKPSPGMAMKAKKDYPEINLKKAVMVGDTLTDMKFGKSMGMIKVFIETNKKLISENYPLIDMVFPDLKSFANSLDKY